MKILLLIIPLFVLVGCASESGPKTKAVSCAKPVMAALQGYHHAFGDYPQQLDGLRPQYLAVDIPLYDNSDVRHSWFLIYQRVDRNNYTLYLDSAPCSQAVFKDGVYVAGYGPNFR